MKINLLELSGLKEKISVKPSSHISVYSEGYNKCIRDLSTIDINVELDREELAKNIYETRFKQSYGDENMLSWDYAVLMSKPELKGTIVFSAYELADAIISNSNKIIRVVKK